MAATFKALFGWLWPFQGPSSEELAATRLYVSTVKDARTPALYTHMEVPDSLDGRFDSIALHLFILLRHMKPVASLDAVSHELIGIFMSDLDQSLREMGVGDMSVGKHVKKMANAFYGRLFAYDSEIGKNEDETAFDDGFKEALRRNLYRGVAVSDDALEQLLDHIKRYKSHVDAVDPEWLSRGILPPMQGDDIQGENGN
jgi:cytochrome b pre-mRNA-processing protein 3